MDDFRLNLRPTLDLHHRIEELASRDPARVENALNSAQNRFMIEAPGDSGNKQTPGGALSALPLSPDDIEKLNRFSRSLHAIVERILDRVIASEELFGRYFAEHARIRPFLRKSAGSENWQLISRYDFMLSPSGQIRLLELNTGCPGGFMVVNNVVETTVDVFRGLGINEIESWESANMMPGVIVDTILTLEEDSGLEKGLVAILNDENGLMFELEQMAEAFRKEGRDSRVVDSRTLRFENGKLYHENDYISASYNKFRISTPESPNHCWKAGFEGRYQAFLEAQNAGSFVSVNNLCGMSIAEDKGLIGLFFDPEFSDLFTAGEKELIRECVPWTTRLEDKKIDMDGSGITPLIDYVRDRKEQLVIKPANEGRGFGVLIGKETDQDTWNAACIPDPKFPCIVQEFVNSLSLRIGNIHNGNLLFRPTYLTVAAALANGKPMNFVSRASTEAVTNVAKHGFVQAIFSAEQFTEVFADR